MKLPTPADKYDRTLASEAHRLIEQADRQNLKRGEDINLGSARVILTSPDGTRYALTVANGGTLSTTAV